MTEPSSRPLAGAPLARLLVATDLSPRARRALDRAALLPLAPAAVIELVHAVPDAATLRRAGGDLARVRRAVGDEARRLRRRLAARGLTRAEVSVHVASGSPAVEILRRAEATSPDLVVVGRHGGGGLRSLLMGSTAEHVVRGRLGPVLVVGAEAARPYARALVALDPLAPPTPLGPALRLLPAAVSRLDVVGAHEVPFEGYLRGAGVSREALHRLRAEQATACRRALAGRVHPAVPAGTKVTVFARRGDARRVVQAVAARRAPDLLAVGTHGRRGLARFLLGSVAADLLRSAGGRDVLIVPPEPPARAALAA